MATFHRGERPRSPTRLGRAVVSHPFAVGTVLPLRFAVERTGSSPERLRDAYLEPFTSLAPLTELQESFSHGYLLGALVRALAWAALDVPREVSAELGDPVPAWLEIFDGIAAGIITLGRHDARSGDESRSRPLRKAWELQRAVAAEVADGARPDTILLLEHPPTVTTGRRTEESELHIPAGAVVDVVETNRGGKSTFHGPGQLVCYPIFDLTRHGQDVKRYCRELEEALILTLGKLGVDGERIDGSPGSG